MSGKRDPEMLAMSAILKILGKLDEKAQRRVVGYVTDKLRKPRNFDIPDEARIS